MELNYHNKKANIEILKEIGLSRKEIDLFINNKLNQNILSSLYKQTAKDLSKHNLSFFVENKDLFFATNQLDSLKLNPLEKEYILIKCFSSNFISLRKELLKHNIDFRFCRTINDIYRFGIKLYSKNKILPNKAFAKLHFNLFFNYKQKPSIILANTQVLNEKLVKKIERKYLNNKRLINYLYKTAVKIYPLKSQKLFYNPTFSKKGFMKPNDLVLCRKLGFSFHNVIEDSFENKLYNKAKENLKRREIGMYKSVAVKSGFKRNDKKRFWHMKR
jgi:hypothetical protein